ncbi:Thymocyte nuclear protein 1 [Dinochytrium kinnereticum]|nr:Thymocyte nuclear protein 1 [Dinochytrium kinnereticum]
MAEVRRSSRLQKRTIQDVDQYEQKAVVEKKKKPKEKPAANSTLVTTHSDAMPDDIGGKPKYFLMKAEPETRIVNGVDVKFSIDDLAIKGTSSWDGVRNYEARNIMKDQMKKGDLVLFYHSNCKIPGIAGICKVAKEAYADHTAFDKSHPYYDEKSEPESPRWFMVDVEYVRKLKRFLPLKFLQQQSQLNEMVLIKRGRLSVQTVRPDEFEFILNLENTPEE